MNFLVCGVQKGGTSAKDAYLRQHPDVCMADVKEPHFFDDERVFASSDVDYSVYHDQFTTDRAGVLVGEATPIYSYWRNAVQRIWQYNPDMKLILILRNPVDRAYSHWSMERARGNESISFRSALAAESERLRLNLPEQHRVYSYIDRGFYQEQIRRIWNFFHRDQILILNSDIFRRDTDEVMRSVYGFLGLAPAELPVLDEQQKNTAVYVQDMGDDVKQQLRSVYEFEIKGLERMLGWESTGWLS